MQREKTNGEWLKLTDNYQRYQQYQQLQQQQRAADQRLGLEQIFHGFCNQPVMSERTQLPQIIGQKRTYIDLTLDDSPLDQISTPTIRPQAATQIIDLSEATSRPQNDDPNQSLNPTVDGFEFQLYEMVINQHVASASHLAPSSPPSATRIELLRVPVLSPVCPVPQQATTGVQLHQTLKLPAAASSASPVPSPLRNVTPQLIRQLPVLTPVFPPSQGTMLYKTPQAKAQKTEADPAHRHPQVLQAQTKHTSDPPPTSQPIQKRICVDLTVDTTSECKPQFNEQRIAATIAKMMEISKRMIRTPDSQPRHEYTKTELVQPTVSVCPIGSHKLVNTINPINPIGHINYANHNNHIQPVTTGKFNNPPGPIKDGKQSPSTKYHQQSLQSNQNQNNSHVDPQCLIGSNNLQISRAHLDLQAPRAPQAPQNLQNPETPESLPTVASRFELCDPKERLRHSCTICGKAFAWKYLLNRHSPSPFPVLFPAKSFPSIP
ncbi:hypothetical protein BZA77DRAFT_291194 [Pyronema omphalodes]|nr:hypothetical protein BZA77DRAFT_291194 [Pyronema omphalodes]